MGTLAAARPYFLPFAHKQRWARPSAEALDLMGLEPPLEGQSSLLWNKAPTACATQDLCVVLLPMSFILFPPPVLILKALLSKENSTCEENLQ